MATIQSVDKALSVLNYILVQNFVHGVPQHRIAAALGLSASNVSRYIDELKRHELIESVADTGHVRASHRLARAAATILDHINQARDRLDRSVARITTPITE
ncbi:hypothetical protein SIID45300_01046 [Candidatus Magnetaquicoccaceae bacterium FCR-1]|uniref:HTH iclR-type domain-containing protein n=1 Tax=Candidatus Magnetaquiglobus chichijimensis TaxID=3141448 RepID=A0ABQ0C7R2_9PROT